MRDKTLTDPCPSCGVPAGETCLESCAMEDFKDRSEVARLEAENRMLRRRLAKRLADAEGERDETV